MRLIDANALEQIITEKFKEHYGNTVYQFMRDFFTFVIRQIRKAPTIEAETVRHGRWIHDYNNLYGCSECMERETMSPKKLKPYCPNCGAKMDGGENNG